MRYELALELKNVGFPNSSNWVWHDDYGYITHEASLEKEMFKEVPALSELIEACGDRFSSLTRSPRNTWYVAEVKNGSQVELVRDIECSTPEEAVAKLWLELNK